MSTVFLIGATGYIGGAVLVELQRAYPTFKFKALARDVAAVDAFNRAAGPNDAKVEAVKGSFEDSELVTRLTYEADIVIATTDAGNVGLKDALLKGFKKRFDDGKPVGAYIHTGGAANFLDGTKEGKYDPTAKIWTDDERDIRQLNETMVNGQVDIPLLKAQEDGYLNAYIIIPGGIHGIGGGPLKRPSMVYKLLLADALQNGKLTYIGEGTNVFSWVHIDDLVLIYVNAFRRLVEANGKKLLTSPYERYVIAGRQFTEMRQVAAWMAAELFKLGKVDSPEAVSIPLSKAGPIATVMTSQSALYRIGRAYTLGWKIISDCPTLQETLADDLRVTVGNGKSLDSVSVLSERFSAVAGSTERV
ncbi:hypothetical protein PHLGIDRAFT_121145 [Phlebiopsis gigantea 11061_1 CR5-6]|uniref:Uncharacterized protein n=1 Tax=Phlebiopsis gigantea (strain 11061_1 CR5-6) TaxID=745531 RepID=A0A0C3NGQ3_PHLG1|nr:hypothetical protein PHLGIDRAFT_121145 [Phlebiopsis gigantea 11061_1 CR5-6]